MITTPPTKNQAVPIEAAIGLGLLIFAATRRAAGNTINELEWKSTARIWPWLVGLIVLGWLGRYGGGQRILPSWIDLLTVTAFSLCVYYIAVRLILTPSRVQEILRQQERHE